MLLLLDPYVDVILALALAYLSLKIIEALFGPLGGLPGIGSAIVSLERTIAQSVAHACGTVVQPVDTVVGKSLVGLAGLINRLSAVIRSHGRVLADIASFVPPFAIDLAALRALVHATVHANTGTAAQVKTLERELHGIEHQVKQLERDVSKGIGEDVLPKLKTLNREIAHIDNAELPAIRGNVATAEGEIGNLFDWIRGKADIIGVGTIATAVAAAVGIDAWNFFRCKQTQGWGKAFCGLPSDIANALIAGLSLFLVGEGLVEFAKHEQGIVDDAKDAALAFWQIPASGPGGDRAIGSPTVNG